MDCRQTHRQKGWLTHSQTNEDKNLKKTTWSVVNAGSPGTEYLYYPSDVEGVTLKGSLLLAHLR